jgi:hypothetical protein
MDLALLGDPTATRLCLERNLPPCRERTVEFALPSIESAADIAPAMKAVTSALAKGEIPPREAATIAAVVDTFVRAIERSDFERRLKEAGDSLSQKFGSRGRLEADRRRDGLINHEDRFCCRSAAGAAKGNSRQN